MEISCFQGMWSADHIHFVSFQKVHGLQAKKWQLATGAQQFWVCQQDRGATRSYAKWFLLRRRECSSVSKRLNFLVRQEPTTAMLSSPQTFGTSTNSAWMNGLRPPTGGNILLSLECDRLIIFISSLFRRSMDCRQRNGNWQLGLSNSESVSKIEVLPDRMQSDSFSRDEHAVLSQND